MFRIILNGSPMELEKEMTLKELQEKLNFKEGQVAVAVDHHFVPKALHESFKVQNGHEIEIVSPMQGG